MGTSELARQQRWLMIVRVVTVTTLLVSVYAIELTVETDSSLQPLFTLAAIAYGLVAIYAVMDRWFGEKQGFLYFQLIGDALVISGFVGITGGPYSPMSFLYLMPIGVASMTLYRRGGITLAVASWVLYAAVVLGRPFGPEAVLGTEFESGRIWYSLVVHLLGMVAVALLSSYLSERIRVQGHELDERHDAVEELQALNKNIIESIQSGLITTDPEGRVHFINRGGTRILGLERPQVSGQSILSLFDLDPEFLQRTQEQVVAQHRQRFERFFRCGDGRTIFLGIAVTALNDRNGEPVGYIFTFQDVTDLRALEQEVRLKERMAALGEMAAGMAHELRNPLAAISGAVQYLKGDLQPAGETLELMDIILRESQRLDHAIRDFLTFARPGKFSPSQVDVVKLIEDHVKLMRKSREFLRGHQIETHYPSAEVWCQLDANRVKQVFWNLATNAVKAMPHGGTLSIEVGVDEGQQRIWVRFADEGVGMTEHQKQRYFQPFCSSFEEGTGLGAAIVYRLVEEHGGKISIDSSLEAGTAVTVDFPRRSYDTSTETGERYVAAGGF